MPIKQIPNIPCSTCSHVNIRPQFKKQQNGEMNIQLSNMREIFLTFTIHSFDLAACTFVFLLNVYTLDNISPGWLIACNLHIHLKLNWESSTHATQTMYSNWCSHVIHGNHTRLMHNLQFIWEIPWHLGLILYSTGWKTEGEFAFYRHMYSTYQEECWVSTSFSSQVGDQYQTGSKPKHHQLYLPILLVVTWVSSHRNLPLMQPSNWVDQFLCSTSTCNFNSGFSWFSSSGFDLWKDI